MKPATLKTKWQTQKFTAANYDKIDDTYLAEFAGDVAQTILDAGGPAASGWTSVNASNSLLKAYRYLTRAEIAANGKFGQAFEELDYSTCCIQTKVLVEKYQPDPAVPMVFNQVLVAVWDKTAYGDPERYVHVDGSFRENDTTPAKFVPIDSPAAKYGYLRRYDPATTDWAYGELTIFEQNGTDYFATAQVAGGPLGVPDTVPTADWKPAAAPQQASLLSQNNAWTGINYFEKGLRLPLGGFIDENGHFYTRQVDVGQKHFTFGRYYSLAKDSLIQWKPDDFINQDGDGDVGLGRVGPGVLEVNTGTAGQAATLNVLDVVAKAAPAAYNTLAKIAAGLASLVRLVPARATQLVDTNDTRLQDLARGFIDFQNEVELYQEDIANNANSVVFATLPFQTGRSFRISSHLNTPVDVVIKLPNPGYSNRYVEAFRISPGVTQIKTLTILNSDNQQVSKLTLGQSVVVRGEYGGWSVLLSSGTSGYDDTALKARVANIEVATPTGTNLVFSRLQAEYPPIYSGTFTVDPTGALIGATVFVELGAAASAPTLDASVFELAGGSFASGKRNEYGFRVAASGKIHYVINQLP